MEATSPHQESDHDIRQANSKFERTMFHLMRYGENAFYYIFLGVVILCYAPIAFVWDRVVPFAGFSIFSFFALVEIFIKKAVNFSIEHTPIVLGLIGLILCVIVSETVRWFLMWSLMCSILLIPLMGLLLYLIK